MQPFSDEDNTVKVVGVSSGFTSVPLTLVLSVSWHIDDAGKRRIDSHAPRREIVGKMSSLELNCKQSMLRERAVTWSMYSQVRYDS
jgi:hypothetical protein